MDMLLLDATALDVPISSKPMLAPAMGPMYGTRLNMPAIKPIKKALGAPNNHKPSDTIVVMIAT